MDWQDELIRLYLELCQHYEHDLWVYAERFSPNNQPHFTDEEVLTIYLWGLMQGQRKISKIYEYTHNHLLSWFPKLPAYQTYVDRLNRLDAVLKALVMRLVSVSHFHGLVEARHMIDSIPIVMAHEPRHKRAKVASEFANCGYCATKDMHYYGAKLHMIALRRPYAMPIPDVCEVTPASFHDSTVLQELAEELQQHHIIGDRAYPDQALEQQFIEHGGLLQTPVKRKRNQPPLTLFQKAYNTLISKLRQPIETLMEWIQEKTGIQNASNVRSTKGLFVHIYGRLTAAIWLFFHIFNS